MALSYNKLLKEIELETLMERRERLCLEFADKAIKHSKFRTSLSKSRGNPLEKARFADTIARPSTLN